MISEIHMNIYILKNVKSSVYIQPTKMGIFLWTDNMQVILQVSLPNMRIFPCTIMLECI